MLAGSEVLEPVDVLGKVVYASVVGPLVGFGMGLVCIWLMSLIWADDVLQVATTVVAAWGSFYFGEMTGSSGVLAVVFTGLTLSAYSTSYVSAEAHEVMLKFWRIMEYIANTLLFIFSGIVVVNKLSNVNSSISITGYEWGMLVVLYFLINIIRGVTVLILWYPLCWTGYGFNWKKGVMVSFAGLRGAVGLIAALFLVNECTCHIENPAPCLTHTLGDLMMFFMAGIVLLTNLINSPLSKPLLAYVKLNKQTAAAKLMYDTAVFRMQRHTELAVQSLKRQPAYRGADWEYVWSFMPVFSEELFEEGAEKRATNKYIQHGTDAKLRRKLAKHSKARFLGEECTTELLVSEARHRFLNLVKSSYKRQFREGACNSWPALKTLLEASSRAQDHDDTPMDEWGLSLKQHCFLPEVYHKSFVGSLLMKSHIHNYVVTRRLSAGYDIAVSFIDAHLQVEKEFRSITIDEHVAATVVGESHAQVMQARAYLRDVESSFEEVARAIKTNIAVQRLLKDSVHFAHHLLENAEIGERDFESIEAGIERELRRLNRRTHVVKVHSEEDILSNAYFFEGVEPETKRSVLAHATFRIFKNGDTLMRRGDRTTSVFVIVRGRVKMLMKRQHLGTYMDACAAPSPAASVSGSDNEKKMSNGKAPLATMPPNEEVPLVGFVPSSLPPGFPVVAPRVAPRGEAAEDVKAQDNGDTEAKPAAQAIFSGGLGGLDETLISANFMPHAVSESALPNITIGPGYGVGSSGAIYEFRRTATRHKHKPHHSSTREENRGEELSMQPRYQDRAWSVDSDGSAGMRDRPHSEEDAEVRSFASAPSELDRDDGDVEESAWASLRPPGMSVSEQVNRRRLSSAGEDAEGDAVWEALRSVDFKVHSRHGSVMNITSTPQSTAMDPDAVAENALDISIQSAPVALPPTASNSAASSVTGGGSDVGGGHDVTGSGDNRHSTGEQDPEAPWSAPPAVPPMIRQSSGTSALARSALPRNVSTGKLGGMNQSQNWMATSTRLLLESPEQGPQLFDGVLPTLDVGPTFSTETGEEHGNGADSKLSLRLPHLPPLRSMMRSTSTPKDLDTVFEAASQLELVRSRSDPEEEPPQWFGDDVEQSRLPRSASEHPTGADSPHDRASLERGADGTSPVPIASRLDPSRSNVADGNLPSKDATAGADAAHHNDSLGAKMLKAFTSLPTLLSPAAEHGEAGTASPANPAEADLEAGRKDSLSLSPSPSPVPSRSPSPSPPPTTAAEEVWAILGRGDTVGELELVAESPVMATAVCESFVEVFEIKHDFMEGVLKHDLQGILTGNLLKQAGLLALESHYPHLRNAPFSLLKFLLHHIEVVRPRMGLPHRFGAGKGIVLRYVLCTYALGGGVPLSAPETHPVSPHNTR